MFNIFKKNSDMVDEFYKSISSKDFSLVSVNLKGSTLVAQFSTFKSQESFKISEGLIYFTNISGKTFTSNSELVIEKSLSVLGNELLKKYDQAKQEMHKFPNISEPEDGETKGQEWLKVSSYVLSESYKKATNDRNLLIESNIYIGKRDATSEFSIRFQSYNLDFSYSFKNTGKILVNVYDDKNLERGSSKKASYNGEFYNNRPIILDQILTVMSDSIKSSDFRIFS